MRVRLVVPPFGFGMKLAEMSYWLDRNAGRTNYFMGGGSINDALARAVKRRRMA